MGDRDLVDRLRVAVGGAVLADEPLARHTTMRVGGPALALVRADDPDDLVAVAEVCSSLGRPFLILGRGSNLLVADGGWPGVVVVLGPSFRGVDVDGEQVLAGAGEPMPALAHAVALHQLGGLAFGVAIPGSLGGAVRMNAGAHGHELREVLLWADVVRLAERGRPERWSVADLRMRYRHSVLPPDAVVVRARLGLRRVGEEELKRDMAEMKRWRREHQPLGEPSCGSVFRNPPGDSAGRLVEAAGMKGHRVGGARVSELHANFISVDPRGKAADVHRVIRDVQEAVVQRHGIELQTEVVLAGFGGG